MSRARRPRRKAGSESAARSAIAFRDDGLQADERNLATDLAAEKARKDAKDVLLNEAVHIVSDAAGVLPNSVRIADRLKPEPMALPH